MLCSAWASSSRMDLSISAIRLFCKLPWLRINFVSHTASLSSFAQRILSYLYSWDLRCKIFMLATSALVILGTSTTLSAQETSPAERARWAEITHKLESDPLNDSLNKEGERAQPAE